MIYIFDVLKQNHQFELLLGKGMEKVGSIVTLIEQYLPKTFSIYLKSGFPQALEIMENLENHTKKSMHEKIMEFEKHLNNHGKIMKFCDIIWRNHQ